MKKLAKVFERAAVVSVIMAIGAGLYTTGLGAFLVKAFGILGGHVLGLI